MAATSTMCSNSRFRVEYAGPRGSGVCGFRMIDRLKNVNGRRLLKYAESLGAAKVSGLDLPDCHPSLSYPVPWGITALRGLATSRRFALILHLLRYFPRCWQLRPTRDAREGRHARGTPSGYHIVMICRTSVS
jgi:hypothetical protein